MKRVGKARRYRGLHSLVLLAGLGGAACGAAAQVIEIAPDGSVASYNRPAVYTSEGVTPITVSPPERRIHAPTEVSAAISHAAARYPVSANLIEAVAWQESRMRQSAVSVKGAVGVMQLMDATARDLGVDRYDLRQNVEGGASYLARMLARYDGNLAFALAAYNAGPGAVDRYRGIPPYAETRAYVAAIMGRLAEMVQLPSTSVTVVGR